MKRRNDSIVILKLVSIFSNLIFYAPVALLIRTRAGITLPQFFLLQVILSLTILILEIPLGYVSDLLGYKKTLVLSYFTSFMARLLLFFAKDFELFVIEAVIEGIAAALLSGTFSSYLYNMSDNNIYAKNLSIVNNFSNAGFIISTITFSILNTIWGLDSLLVGTIICSLLAFLFSTRLKSIPFKYGSKTETDSQKLNPFKFLYHLNKIDFLIIVLTSLISVSFILVNFFYVSILIDFNIDESYMSIFILLYTAIQLSVPYIIGKIGEYNSIQRIRVILVVISILVLGIASLKNVMIFVPMLLLPTGLSILGIFLDKYQNVHIDNLNMGHHRAAILSLYSMISNFIDIVFLLVSSKTSQLGVYNVFLALGIIIVTMACIMLATKSNPRD